MEFGKSGPDDKISVSEHPHILSDSFYSAQSKAPDEKEGTSSSLLTNNLFLRIDEPQITPQTGNNESVVRYPSNPPTDELYNTDNEDGPNDIDKDLRNDGAGVGDS